jgi:hypothetical protein
VWLKAFLWLNLSIFLESSSNLLIAFVSRLTTLTTFIIYSNTMVRHKKDNFSRGGKKFSNPRSRPVPRDENDPGSSRPPFKAACWDLGHCDPKRCSGKRLMQFGVMRELAIGQKFQGVVVSYVAPRFFIIETNS